MDHFVQQQRLSHFSPCTCDIVKKIKLGNDKVSYTICYGIALYFQNRLLLKLGLSHVVVAFDDSLNKIAQKEQMAVLVMFWDLADANVKTCYLMSYVFYAILMQKI